MCANAWGICPARATLWPVRVVVMAGQMRLRAAGSLLGAQIEDPENERTIFIAAGGLLLLGLALAAGTFVWWRSSRVEHPALGPLEVMGTRSWWKGDWTARRRRLDEARPTGAEHAEDGDEPVDLHAVGTTEPLPFDDLADPAIAAAAADAEAAAAAESISLEELVAALGIEPVAAAADDPTAAAVVPRPSVIIDTSAPSREVEEPPLPAATEQRGPIDPLLRQQRSE